MVTTKIPRVSEAVEQQHIVQLFRSVGGASYVLGTRRRKGDFQGTMQTPGVADLINFLPVTSRHQRRRLVFVEVKGQGGRLRPEQVVFRQLCVDADVVHIVGGLDAVIAWMLEEQYLSPSQLAHYRVPSQFREAQPR